MNTQSVAVIGLGAMGAPIARRLQSARFKLTVCDTDPAASSLFSAHGARGAASPAQCAACDVILVLVATPEQVQEVIVGKQGVLAGVGETHRPIVVVMSTVSTEVIEGLLPALNSAHIALVDAPISGGSIAAEHGTLTVLTGGDVKDIEALKPVFESFSARQIHCGPIGSAQTTKIINNIVGTSIAMLAGEAYRLGIEQGLDPVQLSEVFEACSGRNSLSKDPAGPQGGYAELVRDAHAYRRITAILRKDLELALAMSAHSHGEYPAIRAMKGLADSLGPETFENWQRIASA
jgi:3-hydroxyisobutyrate dehydrogenase-like beta-hydroxyacid dehydrogenase